MMKKITRKERIGAIVAYLTKNPNKQFPLSFFCDIFHVAKSTMSEDMGFVGEILKDFSLGSIEMKMGAGGGVHYLPYLTEVQTAEFLRHMSKKLSDPARILPGGYIYTVDVFSNPKYVGVMGNILAGAFKNANADFVITVETKGIPLALNTADALNIPLVIARRDSKLTEGSVVTINYLSGSSKRMQTMSLAKRAVRVGQRALIIDDFIAGGGTISALYHMMKEFSITVAGCAAAIVLKTPQKKRVGNYKYLFSLENVDEEKQCIMIHPNEAFGGKSANISE